MQWYPVGRTSSLLAFVQPSLLYIAASCTWLWKTCLGDGGFCLIVPGWTCTRCISTDGRLPLHSKSGLTSTRFLHWLIGIGIPRWSFLTSLTICRQRGTNARFRAGWMNWINGDGGAGSGGGLDRACLTHGGICVKGMSGWPSSVCKYQSVVSASNGVPPSACLWWRIGEAPLLLP